MVSDGSYCVYFHHLEELDQLATELYGDETLDLQDRLAKKG